MAVQFAYLQLHSRFSPFGGVTPVERLTEQLLQIGESGPIAAALTDTFGLAGWPFWAKSLAGSAVTPLAGAEIGISQGGRNLPYGLILLAESKVGFANLSRLVSEGLLRAGLTPLTATLDLETLQSYREGLIAIAPYWGGPLMAALNTGKGQEARSRAQALQAIFGPNFFIGAPPLAAQPQPQTIEEQSDENKRLVRSNAGLVKLARDLKIGLVGTGEARYARPEEARAYSSLRGRLQRALSAQYPLVSVQHPTFSQDWLYAFGSGRPLTDLQLRDPAELLAHYNERDWPGALSNNLLIVERCGSWFKPSQPLARLRQECEGQLSAHPDGEKLRLWLDSELAEIEELGLADSLLGAAQVVRQGQQAGLVTVARRLNGSTVGLLLGLSEQAPQADFAFEAYTEGRPVRLEVGRAGRARLLDQLNGQTAPTEWKAAGLSIADDPGEPAILHPRRVLLSLDGTSLASQVVLQPGLTQAGTEVGVQAGPLAPFEVARLEIAESSGVSRLQLTLDILNDWRSTHEQPVLAVSQIMPGDLSPTATERELLLARLEWLRLHEPAAYFAAQLELTDDPARRATLAEAVRLEGIALLKPEVGQSQVGYRLEDSPAAIRVGLGRLVEEATVELIEQARPFTDLNDFISRVPLKAEEIERLAWAGALDELGQREQLAASAQTLVTTALAWQEWRQAQAATSTQAATPGLATPASEQLSLFGLFDSIETTPDANLAALEPPAPVVLAEAEPLSRLQSLRRAYETLGFFTTEHPLWSQVGPTASDAATDLPMALADLEGQTENRPWLITGLVTGIRRLPLRLSPEQGQGEELTVLQIEDFSAQVQLIVPRATLAPDLTLAEGVALSARVYRLKKDQHQVLIAVALAAYPALPGTPAAPAPDDLIEPDASNSVAPQDEENWSESLFATLEPPAPAVQTIAAMASANTNKGKGTKAAPPRTRRQVAIHLPRTGSPEQDLAMMNRLKQILRDYAGDDQLILFIPTPDGGIQRIEPQGLTVAYTEAFATAVINLVGPKGLQVEEYTY